MKILIIEDENSLMELMTRALTKEGYVIEQAVTFRDAENKLAVYDYDCILLDIMLPDGNGLQLLEQLKAQGKQGSIIIISAKDSLEDKVAGLDQGADDYLAKPFHLMELSARVKSVIRRSHIGGSNHIALGNTRIDFTGSRVFIADKEVILLKKEFDILLFFMQRPNHIIDKMTLAESVWGDHVDQVDNFHFVYAQIKNLRQKLIQHGATIEIKAIYGFGQKLIETS